MAAVDQLWPSALTSRVDVEVVEQHEFARQLVMIGRDVLAEQHQRGIAVAFLHVAEHLIVGAILLDDVDDVLDRRQRAWRAIQLVASR